MDREQIKKTVRRRLERIYKVKFNDIQNSGIIAETIELCNECFFDYDKRFKLTGKEISEIQELRKQGYTLMKLSHMYDCATATISYWTDTKFREEQREKNKKRAHSDYQKIKQTKLDRRRDLRKFEGLSNNG